AAPRSSTRAPGGTATAEPTSVMRSPSTRTMAGASGGPPRPSIRRPALTMVTTGASARAANGRAARPTARGGEREPRRRRTAGEGLVAGQDPVHAGGDVLEVGGVGAPRGGAQLRRHPAAVAGLGEGLAHLDPVDVALAEVDPVEPAVRAVELEVLQVDLRDARPERADPVLRITIEDHVDHVAIGIEPRGLSLVDVLRELRRAVA